MMPDNGTDSLSIYVYGIWYAIYMRVYIVSASLIPPPSSGSLCLVACNISRSCWKSFVAFSVVYFAGALKVHLHDPPRLRPRLPAVHDPFYKLNNRLMVGLVSQLLLLPPLLLLLLLHV